MFERRNLHMYMVARSSDELTSVNKSGIIFCGQSLNHTMLNR
jgi:hypothetical protein